MYYTIENGKDTLIEKVSLKEEILGVIRKHPEATEVFEYTDNDELVRCVWRKSQSNMQTENGIKFNIGGEINPEWSDYDKVVAQIHLEEYCHIYLDEYGKPIDNENDLENIRLFFGEQMVFKVKVSIGKDELVAFAIGEEAYVQMKAQVLRDAMALTGIMEEVVEITVEVWKPGWSGYVYYDYDEVDCKELMALKKIRQELHEEIFGDLELTIYDVIHNAMDELKRAKAIIGGNEETEKVSARDMLLEDMEKTIPQIAGLKKRIEYALVLAVYAGQKNAITGYPYDCDSVEWTEKYVNAASSHIFTYDSQGVLQTEVMYEDASETVDVMFREKR